ncbi:hypothetical protein GCM10009105_38440 [Dokdonella soli]|uniref:Nicotinamide riboside transporter PnuC n=1 Tax=Dokdonella soli TaxID=529810 RepID=A0ABN1J149_9GAMM
MGLQVMESIGVIGFVTGCIGSVWLAIQGKRWAWLLLLVPSFADAFYTLLYNVSTIGGMH